MQHLLFISRRVTGLLVAFLFLHSGAFGQKTRNAGETVKDTVLLIRKDWKNGSWSYSTLSKGVYSYGLGMETLNYLDIRKKDEVNAPVTVLLEKDSVGKYIRFHSSYAIMADLFITRCTFGYAVSSKDDYRERDQEFSFCKFDTLVFDDVEFDSPVDFDQVDFNHAKFRTVLFYKGCRFSECHFRNDVELIGCIFTDSLNFSEVELDGNLSITGCILPDTLNLSGIEKYKSIRLMNNSLYDSRRCVINLLGTDVTNLRMNFEDYRLYIPANPTDAEWEQTINLYENLLQNFKKNGQLDDFERLSIEYEEWKYKQAGFWGRIGNAVDRYWWNYGFDKTRILFWTLLLFFIFWVINTRYLSRLLSSVYDISDLDTNFQQRLTKRRNDFFIRSGYAFIYTAYIFFGLKLEIDKMRHRKVIPVIYIFTCYLAGLVCLAFIVRYVFNF